MILARSFKANYISDSPCLSFGLTAPKARAFSSRGRKAVDQTLE